VHHTAITQSREARLLTDYHENRGGGGAIRCAAFCETVVSAGGSPDLKRLRVQSMALEHCVCVSGAFHDPNLSLSRARARDSKVIGATPRSLETMRQGSERRKIYARDTNSVRVSGRYSPRWHAMSADLAFHTDTRARDTMRASDASSRPAPTLLKLADSCNPILYTRCPDTKRM